MAGERQQLTGYVFPRQYERIVDKWRKFTMRRTKPMLIYRRTKNLRAIWSR